ncbi:hypothetical protein K438DRAFT_1910239 [Mycena galopus ATCC 62051]|nr:hypothetical protein K438DRAFT_1910239 [Mycena galopus ATCC 62051]
MASPDAKHTRLKEMQKRLKIPTNRKPPAPEVARQAVIDKVQLDTSQNNGLNHFKTVLQQEGMMVPRDTILKIMLEHFSMGFHHRFPGKKKSVIPCTRLNSNGSFHEVLCDGHEKLGKQALDMGDIGLPIYGYKDKWTHTVLFLWAIGHLFLDFIKKIGAILVQMTVDKGSEIARQYAIQDALWSTCAPHIDPDIHPVCQIIKSVHNIIIEGFWHWFREKKGLNLKTIILVGKFPTLVTRPLFYWVFVPLLQVELDEFCLWWNHQVHTRWTRICLPALIHLMPWSITKNYGSIHCHIPVPEECMITDNVGPREAHLSCYTRDFGKLAQVVYEQIGKPGHWIQLGMFSAICWSQWQS